MDYLKTYENFNEFHRDIFYKVRHLSFETKIEILEWTYEHSYDFHVDVLKDIARKKTNLSFDEGMEYFKPDSHFVVIHRRGYDDWNTPESWNKWHLEVGFRSMCDIDYFMFIYCDENLIDEAVKKFKLEIL